MRRQHVTTTLNRVLLPSLRRGKDGNRRKISSNSGNGSSSSNSSNGCRRMSHTPLATSASDTSARDSWDVENLASCAARKQVRVSLDSVLNVSTGRAPWTNPELRAHREVGKNRSSAVDPDAPGHALNTDFACTTAEVGQLQSAQYLHRELPIRLASAILELDKMEDTGLPGTPSVRRVRQRYLQSFSELQEIMKPAQKESVETFTATLKRALDRSDDIVLLMARGLQELASRSGSCYQESRLHSGGGFVGSARMERVQAFLDSFYQNRVAMRFLAGHYLALSSPPREGYVGLVQRDVGICKVAQAAALEAASICSHALGSCPGVHMVIDDSGDRLRAAVPEYLHYIVLELLKNAMRATMQVHRAFQVESDEEAKMSERQDGSGRSYFDENEVDEDDEEYEDEEDGDDGDDDVGVRGTMGIKFANVPDVVISVRADGLDDVLVIVSDHGGGIAEEDAEKVWSYLYTTADDAVRNRYLREGRNSRSKPPPLAGLGYGLPLSRLYARSFGGDLALSSKVGEGTEAILRLSRRGTGMEPVIWAHASSPTAHEEV